MFLPPDFILRWLNRVADDEPARLGQGSMDTAQEAWEEDGLRRLTLVEGLLSTLDHKAAPPALDAWFEGLTAIPAEPAPARIPEPEQDWVLDMDAIAAELEREAEDLAAPDFLDRIVEQRLSAIEQEVAAERRVRRRKTWLRRGSWVLTASLLMVLLPFFGGSEGPRPNPIQVVRHESLDSLRQAHPDQAAFAQRSGALFGLLPAAPDAIRNGGTAR
ncbi:MAG: hypothetical protein R3F17_07875 [Planctomycetota bacterium]